MNTLDLTALDRITAKAQKLQAIARDLQPFLEKLKDFDGALPTDRLIRSGEAAKILGVGQDVIGKFVRAGLLTPLYVAGSSTQKFWLSEVEKLVSTEPTKTKPHNLPKR